MSVSKKRARAVEISAKRVSKYARLEARATAIAEAAAFRDDYGNVKGRVKAQVELDAKVHVGEEGKVHQAGADASARAGARAEGMAGIAGKKGSAFAGAEAEAHAQVAGLLHANAGARAGAWASGINGAVRDPEKHQIHIGFGGKAGAGAEASVSAKVGNDEAGVKVKPQIGNVGIKFEPSVCIDEKKETLDLNIGVGAALGIGTEADLNYKVHNPIDKKTRDGIAKGDPKHIARLNPNSIIVRSIMGEPKNDVEEVLQHIPFVGPAMAWGRKAGFW